MPALRATQPTEEGRYRAVHDITANATTDWTDLSSDDFYSLVSGNQLAANKLFYTISVATDKPLYLKLRPKTLVSDPTDYTDGVVYVYGGYLDNPINLNDGVVYTISYKKTDPTTSAQFICGFTELP